MGAWCEAATLVASCTNGDPNCIQTLAGMVCQSCNDLDKSVTS